MSFFSPSPSSHQRHVYSHMYIYIYIYICTMMSQHAYTQACHAWEWRERGDLESIASRPFIIRYADSILKHPLYNAFAWSSRLQQLPPWDCWKKGLKSRQEVTESFYIIQKLQASSVACGLFDASVAFRSLPPLLRSCRAYRGHLSYPVPASEFPELPMRLQR